MQHLPLHRNDEQALQKLSSKMKGQRTDFDGFTPICKVYARYSLLIWEVEDHRDGGSKYMATKAVPVSRHRFDLVPYTMDSETNKVLYSKQDLTALIDQFDDFSLSSLERKR